MKKRNSLILTLALLLSFQAILLSQANRISLNSSAETSWLLKPQSELYNDSTKIFSPRYDASGWVKAVVPGTVFSSYVASGAEPDPNYADNIYKTDKAKYDRNFWYRTEFTLPKDFMKERLWLNFDGVNRDADVFLNGRFLGSVKGIVQRGRFDITNIADKNGKNVLAVLVYLPESPISNGASPTYGSSAGWDWMPYVPGLNMGIQDDVFLSTTGNVSIADPWIKTDITENLSASIQIKTELVNHSTSEQKGRITGVVNPGNIEFSLDVVIPSKGSRTVTFDGNGFPGLAIKNPSLWWPNGYGQQNLYTCDLKFSTSNAESDNATVTFGIRKLQVDTTGSVMKIIINNVKIFAKGGNWGMPEYMLRNSAKDLDTRIKLHKDMNFNIIRNWMGSTTDEEFYRACDKYGILVWDDFWLNSSGGVPRDLHVFNANSVEKIKRLRNHPSIVLWCGDNEGDPAQPINDWLRANVSAYDGRHYHPNSHSYSLTGSGPWRPLEPAQYFMNAAPGNWGGTEGWGMRSEMGTAVFVNYESFKKFIPQDKLWPRNEMWDKHFFGPSAIYAGPEDYENYMNSRYGTPGGIEEFCRKAQLLNIETNKAMYEGWLDNLWNDATGLIIWMSQSAYPSMVWQTYDYYFDATGAYWGAKKACEPIHIQWNPETNTVKAINTTLQDLNDLTAEARVYNLNGEEVKELFKSARVTIKKDTLSECFTLNFPGVDLALKKNTASSTIGLKGVESVYMVDGSSKTKWESDFGEQQWAYVDLGKMKQVDHVRLNFDGSYAKVYKIQLSDDAKDWRDVYYTPEGKSGLNEIYFKPEQARYVRMFCIEKSSNYRVSLLDFEVYDNSVENLSDVHFIRLALKENSGKILSENLYWRGKKNLDYTAINNMPKVELQVKPNTRRENGKYIIEAQITNPLSSKAAAFATHLQVFKSSNGERVLPIYPSDNYFTLMKGETKSIRIEFDESLLGGDKPVLSVKPFNYIAPHK